MNFKILSELCQFQGEQAKKPELYRDTSRISDAQFNTEIDQL